MLVLELLGQVVIDEDSIVFNFDLDIGTIGLLYVKLAGVCQ